MKNNVIHRAMDNKDKCYKTLTLESHAVLKMIMVIFQNNL